MSESDRAGSHLLPTRIRLDTPLTLYGLLLLSLVLGGAWSLSSSPTAAIIALAGGVVAVLSILFIAPQAEVPTGIELREHLLEIEFRSGRVTAVPIEQFRFRVFSYGPFGGHLVWKTKEGPHARSGIIALHRSQVGYLRSRSDLGPSAT
jgi:hypothetical protein